MGSPPAETSAPSAAAKMARRTLQYAKPVREAPLPEPSPFDVRVFLDRALPSKKLILFDKNEVLFSTGERAETVAFLETGMVRLSVTSGSGKTAVVTILNTGDFVGIWCLAGQARRMATATAMVPTTVRLIPKDKMIRLLQTESRFAEYFITYLMRRNMQIGQHVVDLLFDPSEKRLIRALLFLSQFGEKSGDDATLAHVPQELLAEMIGSSRTHVNGFMTKLKRLGFVEYNHGLLRIHRTPLLSLL
jgi:CRP/FNR family cyclic AMP-dependent transcriptional regulator